MDMKQFVASITGSLAWPVAALLILFLFKKEVAARLPALLKLKLPGGIEAEFNKDLVTVAAAVGSSEDASAQTPGEPAVQAGANDAPFKKWTASIDVLNLMVPEPDPIALSANPTGVVMEAWKSLESVLRAASILANPNVHISNRLAFSAILKYLAAASFLTSDELDTLRKLKSMRDLAAHSQEPLSAESASSFAEISDRLARILNTRISQRFPGEQ